MSCQHLASLFSVTGRHQGVLQGRPAGSPGGDEGRTSGQSPDDAAGGGPRQNHEDGAAEDAGEKVANIGTSTPLPGRKIPFGVYYLLVVGLVGEGL